MDEKTFFECVERGEVDRVREAIAENPKLIRAIAVPANAARRQPGSTALHLAINMRQLEAAELLIEAGVDLEARTAEGRTALHDSIEFGCVPLTQQLIAAGAVVDVCSAAILGRLERLRELLDGDPALVDDRSTGLSPLGWASFGNQAESAAELIDRGAKMDDFELLCAASVGHVEVGRLLIERGADPSAVSPEAGGNALHAATAMRYSRDARPFIKMLLEFGVDVNARTPRGDTALTIAEAYDRQQQKRTGSGKPGQEADSTKPYAEVAALLLESGAAKGS